MPLQEGATTHLNRSTHLDVLRAIAALMVIGYHVNALVGGQGLSIPWLRDNTDSGVELFFVLSGYLIALPFLRALVSGAPPPDAVRYARRRAARILPGYWVALVVAAFVAFRIGALPGPGLLVPQVALLQGLIPGEPGGPLVVAWTLSIEAVFYVAVPVVTWMLLSSAPRLVGAVPCSDDMRHMGDQCGSRVRRCSVSSRQSLVDGRLAGSLRVHVPILPGHSGGTSPDST